jgi:hypothetical protein
MRSLALLLALTAGAAGLALGGELTDAAKGAKAKRQASKSRVITNADVKNSKGKVVTTNVPDTPVQKQPTMIEKHAAARAAAKKLEAARLAAQTVVAELETELAALEQAYYDENDLNRRDTVIVHRFNEVKMQLDAARAGLTELDPQPSEAPEPPAPESTDARSANDSE